MPDIYPHIFNQAVVLRRISESCLKEETFSNLKKVITELRIQISVPTVLLLILADS